MKKFLLKGQVDQTYSLVSLLQKHTVDKDKCLVEPQHSGLESSCDTTVSAA